MSDTRRSSTSNAHRRLSARRQRISMDVDVSEKLRDLESDGKPISIAETISREEAKASDGNKDKSAPQPDVINVTELQKMPSTALLKIAAQEGVVDFEDKSKRDLIFLILKERVKSCGIMCGHGTLQILPDGFGFLRSAEYHYLNCPDDIYVSPSQIRKFNLKNGAVVKGQIDSAAQGKRAIFRASAS